MKKLVLLLTCLLAVTVEGYHILCVFGIPSKSHNHLGGGIVYALHKAGHEVTWVTPYPPKENKNGLHIIDASLTLPTTAAIDMTDKRNSKPNMSFIRQFAYNISTIVASIPALKEALVRGKYDAVITETFFCDMDAGYAAVLRVPWIVLSGITLQPSMEGIMNGDRSIATIPLLFNDYPIPMSFYQRLWNVGLYLFIEFDNWWHEQEAIDGYNSMFADIARDRGVDLPPLNQAIQNISILLVNSHSSFVPAQSVPPNVVEIGGFHIEETITPLPKDLQDLLDSSTQGVVYFSMGSVLKSASLPEHTRTALLKMLGELPYTVLWKFETELQGLPKNVHIRPWMPQAAILAHKNTRVFITHGGLLSTLESLRYGVPLIAVPVFGDQPANAARAVRSGYALRVDFEVDTLADQLRVALKEALGNNKYYNRAKYLSSLFNKRPVSPTKLIQHYVELAIETKGAYHLRSKALQYSWYQRWMLDLAGSIALAIYIIYYLLKKLVGYVKNKFRNNKKTTNSNKKVKRN